MASGEDKERKGDRGEKEEGRKREEGEAGTLSYEGTEGESRGWLTRPCKRAGSSSAGKPAGQRRRGTGEEGGREAGGGFACAIQPHREVRPESRLSIYEVYDMKA